MSTTLRKALLLSVAAVPFLAACDGDQPAPMAPAVVAPVNASTPAVASNGLLGGLLGGVTGLLSGVVNGLTYTVLGCDLLPYAKTTKVIGPLGGTISVGHSTLVVPPGALAANTTITAEQPNTNQARVNFAPHGLKFAEPAVLTIGYTGCSTQTGYVQGIVYVDDTGKIIEAPPSIDNPLTKKVTGTIGHFSGYVIAHARTTDATY